MSGKLLIFFVLFAAIGFLLVMYNCASPLASGRQGFDLTKAQEAELKEEKKICDGLGGQFSVRVDNTVEPHGIQPICTR